MKAYELIEWLNEHHPQKFAEDWDNVGLLVGDDKKEISHIFLHWISQSLFLMRLLKLEQT